MSGGGGHSTDAAQDWQYIVVDGGSETPSLQEPGLGLTALKIPVPAAIWERCRSL